MFSKRSKYQQPKKSQRSVEYWKHFPKNFLTMYGPAKPALSPEEVRKRLQPFCCEWLLRPKVAMSEMASTVIGNCELLQQKTANFINNERIKKLINAFKPIVKSLQRLNTQKKKEEDSPSEKDVVKVMEFFIKENDKFDELIDEAYETASSLFSLTTHVIVARTLIRDPEEYAKLIEMNESKDKMFKKKGDVRSLKHLLIEECIGNTKSKRGKKKGKRTTMLEDLHSSDEHRRSGRRKKKQRKSSSSETSCQSSEDVRAKSVEKKSREQTVSALHSSTDDSSSSAKTWTEQQPKSINDIPSASEWSTSEESGADDNQGSTLETKTLPKKRKASALSSSSAEVSSSAEKKKKREHQTLRNVEIEEVEEESDVVLVETKTDKKDKQKNREEKKQKKSTTKPSAEKKKKREHQTERNVQIKEVEEESDVVLVETKTDRKDKQKKREEKKQKKTTTKNQNVEDIEKEEETTNVADNLQNVSTEIEKKKKQKRKRKSKNE